MNFSDLKRNKKMKVLIAGASGMIGSLILNQCLASEKTEEVISFVRKPSGHKHPRLTEVVLADFEDYSAHAELFRKVSAAYFCLGVYTGQVNDELFRRITVNYPVEFARALERNSPSSTFCLLSGAGADRTEKSKTAFARYKGMAENQIAQMNLRFYSFRPGYIFPEQSRKEPNFGYRIFRFLYPLIKMLGEKYSITSTKLAEVMFHAGLYGAEKQILENQDILNYEVPHQ